MVLASALLCVYYRPTQVRVWGIQLSEGVQRPGGCPACLPRMEEVRKKQKKEEKKKGGGGGGGGAPVVKQRKDLVVSITGDLSPSPAFPATARSRLAQCDPIHQGGFPWHGV